MPASTTDGNASTFIYSFGPFSMSVCTTLDPEKMVEEVNAAYPTGISSPWQLSEDETFRTGETNPCLCDQLPELRKHYLLNC